MPISEADRRLLVSMRALTRDAEDREILVGLTHEETEWYFAHAAGYSARPGNTTIVAEMTSDRDQFLRLHARHEFRREQIVVAEVEAVTIRSGIEGHDPAHSAAMRPEIIICAIGAVILVLVVAGTYLATAP